MDTNYNFLKYIYILNDNGWEQKFNAKKIYDPYSSVDDCDARIFVHIDVLFKLHFSQLHRDKSVQWPVAKLYAILAIF